MSAQMYHFSVLALFVQVCVGQNRGPAVVDTKPILLDSFIPASMQIIAHITELMKYDLRPPSGTTTTTVRPTRPHKPGIFQPDGPLGPEAYFAKGLSYQEYVERLKYPSGYNYFDRYKYPLEEEGRSLDTVPQDIDYVLGKDFSRLLRLVNTIEEVREVEDKDLQVQEFSQVYDDSDFRLMLLRQNKKKPPPTRAYVTLLSLYDLLNKESKKLGLNKYNGYSEKVLKDLYDTSSGTSSDQLRIVLSKIVSRRDTRNPQIIKRINDLLKDLQDSSSYLNTALTYIPPLPFVM